MTDNKQFNQKTEKYETEKNENKSSSSSEFSQPSLFFIFFWLVIKDLQNHRAKRIYDFFEQTILLLQRRIYSQQVKIDLKSKFIKPSKLTKL